MKRYVFIFLVLLYILSGRTVFSSSALPSENSSMKFADELGRYILQNISSEQIPSYLEKLVELSPAAGKKNILKTLSEAESALLNKNNGKIDLTVQLLRLFADQVEGEYSRSIGNFSAVKKWNISGPWKKYGRPDMSIELQPEKIYKLDQAEKGENITTGSDGVFYPCAGSRDSFETYYATSSFRAERGIILWIISDGAYRLFINGKETGYNPVDKKNSVKAFSLKGGRGYTVQLKIKSGGENFSPYMRCYITDENYLSLNIAYSGTFFDYNFTGENIYSSGITAESVPPEGMLLAETLKKQIASGNYNAAYKFGAEAIAKYPEYFFLYTEYLPLLDIMKHDTEFLEYLELYGKNFPGRGIADFWLADFFMTRDRGKFLDIMKNLKPGEISYQAAESYFVMLCGEKKYDEALAFSSSVTFHPRFRRLVSGSVKESGNTGEWRKFLIEETAMNRDGDPFYRLGVDDLNHGLDPVMYWKKAFPLSSDPCMIRDLSDLYENSIVGPNDYYAGDYTDYHPEFLWHGKKRKIKVHLFENGRAVIEGEDILPAGKRLKNKKGRDSFTAGEITSSVPYFEGVKILYVLAAKDGQPAVKDFYAETKGTDSLEVKYKCTGDEEFSVIKYSGELAKSEADVFSFLENFILKKSGNEISGLDIEILYFGSFIPLVKYNGEPVRRERAPGGAVKFSIRDMFDEGEGESGVLDIYRFSSWKELTEWYSKLIVYASADEAAITIPSIRKSSTGETVKALHFYVMSSIAVRGFVDFNVRRADEVLSSGAGTVEERTLLARTILERNGIKSFISFRKNSRGLIDRMLLYVPEKKERGYWLDFYGDGVSEKNEPQLDAIVITGEGYEIIPVTPETCIR